MGKEVQWNPDAVEGLGRDLLRYGGEKVEQAHVAAQWAETAKKLNEAADGIENQVKGFDHSKLSMTAGRLLNRRPARWLGA